MANPTIGKCLCPFCGNDNAELRRYKTGKKLLYFYCKNDGMITPNLQGGQDWLLEHSQIYAPQAPVSDEEKQHTETVTEKEPEKPVKEKPHKKAAAGWSILDSEFWDD